MLLILVYSIPIILSYSFPFSSLTGATMALGDLSSKNEIQAMRTSGVSYRQILAPILLFSIALTAFSFVLNDIFLPLGTIKYKQLYKELLYENPGLDIEPYSIGRFNNLIFVNGKVDKHAIDDLVIIDTSSSDVRVIVSDYAELTSDENEQLIELNLYDVASLQPAGKSEKDFDFFSSESMNYLIKLTDISFNLSSVSPNEKSIRDLYADIQRKKAEIADRRLSLQYSIEQLSHQIALKYYTDAFAYDDADYKSDYLSLQKKLDTSISSKTLQYYLLEFYKKTALPFACLFLVFFAFPFSMLQLKNGKLVGFSIGIITSVVYWFLLFSGQTLGARTALPPFLVMWFPNLLLFSAGCVFLALRVRS